MKQKMKHSITNNVASIIFFGRVIGLTCIGAILIIGGIVLGNAEAVTIGVGAVIVSAVAYLAGRG